jgi:lipopolysaccharide biosynthesis glycosyltransferase
MRDEQISVVTFYWESESKEYLPKHVNALAKAVKEHLSLPHRFICVYDAENISGFDESVELVQLPKHARWLGLLANPVKPTLPSSYRRLWAFSKEAKCLGDRILLLDIDCLIVGDLQPLFEFSDDDFIGWRPNSEDRPEVTRRTGGVKRIGGGTWLLRTGTHTHIWRDFNPDMILKAKKAGWRGSDQAWLSYNFASTCTVFPREMGIYHTQDARTWEGKVPENARIIHFNGKINPWEDDARAISWYCELMGVKHDPTIDTAKVRRMKRAAKRWKAKTTPPSITFVAFWWGLWPKNNVGLGKIYVKRLFDSITRNIPNNLDHKFVLFTDQPDIKLENNNIEIRKLDVPLDLRWNLKKMFMYSEESGLSGSVLCFDLDVVIVGSLSPLISKVHTMSSKLLLTCQGAYRRNKQRIGGSIIGFKTDPLLTELLWKTVLRDRKNIEETTRGSERLLYRKTLTRQQVGLWERNSPGRVLSYKKDCKEGLPKGASVVRFHGLPRPHEVQDEWLSEYWR